MSDHHLGSEEFQRLAAGELSQEETTRASLHLLCCPACRRRLAAIASEAAQLLKVLLGDLLSDSSAASPGVFASNGGMGENGTARNVVSSDPERLDQELSQLSPCARRPRIREDSRFHCPELAVHLLRRSWEMRREDPVAAEDLAGQALEIAQCLTETPGAQDRFFDLRARAWAYIGNARRIRSDLKGALTAFEEAEQFLALGSREPLRRAEVLLFKGVAFREQRKLQDATRLFDQAIAIYRWAGDKSGLCQSLICKARIYELEDEMEEAIPLLVEASDLIDAEADPYFLLCVWQNLATCLVNAGEPQEALELLPAVQKLSAEVGQHYDALRLRWLEGLVARDLGETDRAEEILREVRDGFILDGMGFDAALVSLDLASMLLAQNRTPETRRLAEEMLPIFNSMDIRREAFAALILFQRAALREEATVQMVRDIATCLRKAAGTSTLRYEKPS